VDRQPKIKAATSATVIDDDEVLPLKRMPRNFITEN
jgi:hypothetical protein